jgi:hypothetical protein
MHSGFGGVFSDGWYFFRDLYIAQKHSLDPLI